MSFWMLAAQAGTSLFGGFQSYAQGKANAKLSKAQYEINKMTQEANNKLNAIGTADALNAANVNQSLIVEDNINQRAITEVSREQAEGQALVNAAAAGVEGASVDRQLRDIHQQSDNQGFRNLTNLRRGLMQNAQSKSNLLWQQVLSEDRTVNLKPAKAPGLFQSMLLPALQTGVQTYSTYQQAQRQTSVGTGVSIRT